MADHDIRCSIAKNDGCPIAGGEYVIGKTTPSGMCVKAYGAVSTFAAAMRFSDATPWEKGKGEIVVTCPDGFVQYKLTRVK